MEVPHGTNGLQKSRLQVVFWSFWPWRFIFSLQHISCGWQLFGLLDKPMLILTKGCTISTQKYSTNMEAIIFTDQI